MKFVSLNPKPLLVIIFMPLCMYHLWFIMFVNYSQQGSVRSPSRLVSYYVQPHVYMGRLDLTPC